MSMMMMMMKQHQFSLYVNFLSSVYR